METINFSENCQKSFWKNFGVGHPESAKIGYKISQFIEGKLDFDELTKYLDKGDSESIIKSLKLIKCPKTVELYYFDSCIKRIKDYLNSK